VLLQVEEELDETYDGENYLLEKENIPAIKRFQSF
jgi:hypothetical protein